MSYSAVIKFAPIWTFERHNDPNWNRAGRALYQRNSLKFLPNVTEIPLLVDHNEERRIGTVLEMFEMEWVDGPWIAARASLEEPPCWMRRCQTKASFGSKPFGRASYTECELITNAFVEEVSVLISQTPKEPLAEVLLLRRESSSAARGSTSSHAAGGAGYRLKPGETWINTPPGVRVRRFFYDFPIVVQ